MTRNQGFQEVLVWIFSADEPERPRRVAEVLKRVPDFNLAALVTEIKEGYSEDLNTNPDGDRRARNL